MPRDASGNYSLPGGVNPVVAGTTITSNWANTTLDDVALALTDSLDRQGRGGMLAPFRINDGTLPAPGLAFVNETGSGLHRAASQDMYLVLDGDGAIRMRASRIDLLQNLNLSDKVVLLRTAAETIRGSLKLISDVVSLLGSSDGVAQDLPVNVMGAGVKVDAGSALADIVGDTVNIAGATQVDLASTAIILTGNSWVVGDLKVDDSLVQRNGQDINTYDIAAFLPDDAPVDGRTVLRFRAARQFIIPVGGVGSYGTCVIAPTGATYTIDVFHNAGAIGSFQFADGAVEATLSGFVSATTVSPGDLIEFTVKAPGVTALPTDVGLALNAIV